MPIRFPRQEFREKEVNREVLGEAVGIFGYDCRDFMAFP